MAQNIYKLRRKILSNMTLNFALGTRKKWIRLLELHLMQLNPYVFSCPSALTALRDCLRLLFCWIHFGTRWCLFFQGFSLSSTSPLCSCFSHDCCKMWISAGLLNLGLSLCSGSKTNAISFWKSSAAFCPKSSTNWILGWLQNSTVSATWWTVTWTWWTATWTWPNWHCDFKDCRVS